MNCPFCLKYIRGMTGFQEASRFSRHLNKCRKRPKDKGSTLSDALQIRAESGQ